MRLLSRDALFWGGWLLAVSMAVFWLLWVAMLAGLVGDEESLPRIDFFTFWAASSLALDGVASTAYEAEAIWRAEAQLPGDDSGFLAWLNPPTFFFVVLPLALVPVAVSYAAWVVLSGGLVFSAVYRIAVDKPLAILLALTFPASLANLLIGHNGFLIAGTFAWGMLLLRDRPVLGGAMLGLMAFKPQLFPLVLVALVAGRQYRAAASALTCVAVLSLASLAAFGPESWTGFVVIGQRYASMLYDGTLELTEMHSVSAVLLVLGLPELGARLAQVAVAGGCAAFVWWLWRGEAPFEYRAAGLAAALMLATPYSYVYDLVLMGLAVLWLATAFHRDGWRRGDAEALLITWLVPLSFLYLDVSLVPVALLALVLLVVRRTAVRRAQDTRPAGRAPWSGGSVPSSRTVTGVPPPPRQLPPAPAGDRCARR